MIQKESPKTYLNWPRWNIIVSLFSIAGIIIVVYSTVWGAALSDDSYYYISPARNLLSGHGFDLSNHFPPMVPLVLSFIGIAKIDPLISIRWLNAILFGFNIYLVARICLTLTKSFVLSVLGALLVLTSTTLIIVHSWAMSEALFITFILSGLLIYTAGSENVSWQNPVFTGIFFGLATVTRYIGVALLIAGGVMWLLETGKSIRLRLRYAFIFGIAGGAPLFLWTIRNEIVTGQLTSRVLAWHPLPKSMWINALNTILVWIIPGRFVHGKELIWLGGIIFFVVIWLGFYLLKNRNSYLSPNKAISQSKPITLICLCILSYLFILIVSRSFFDSRIPMDERMLSPILLMGLILLVWIFANRLSRRKWLEWGIIVLISIAFLITNLTRSAQTVRSYHELGRGYASARDHVSETYAYIRNRPDVPVYSNAWVAVYFWTGRVTNPLPSPEGIASMKANMRETGAYLVIFDSIPVELYGDTTEELTAGLVEQIRLSEATIYRSP